MHAAVEGMLTTRGGMTSACGSGGTRHGPALHLGCRHRSSVDYAAQTIDERGRRQLQTRATSSPSTARTGQVLQGRGGDAGSRSCPATSAIAHGLGGRRAPHGRARQCRNADRTRGRRGEFGAEGIGLCRTEHMFFDADRIVAVREMILASDDVDGRRKAALAKLLPIQRRGFRGTVRDHVGPARHDPAARPAAARVPAADRGEGGRGGGGGEMAEVAKAMGASVEKLRAPRGSTCTSSTPCSASAACRHRHRLSRRSPRCRRARCSRAPSLAQEENGQARYGREVMVPLVMTARPNSTSSRRASSTGWRMRWRRRQRDDDPLHRSAR